MGLDPKSSADHGAIVLTTPRLRLRAISEADIAPLHEKIFGVAEVMRWLFGGTALSRAESEQFIRANFNFSPAPVGLCALADRASGELIGFAGLNRCQILSDDDLEFGFVLAREAWGRGLATEIGKAQLTLGFERLGQSRLFATASAANAASIKVLEKLGMRHHSFVIQPGRGPRRVFSLTAADWRRLNA